MGKKDQAPDAAENIKVIVRSRPLNTKEKDAGYKSCVSLDFSNSTVQVNHVMGEPDRWTFDGVVNNTLSQNDIFVQYITPLIDSVMSGFNATVFAYGQSGSGKTHTMTGVMGNAELEGIIPRTFNYIFDTARREQDSHPGRKYSMACSFVELYNNKIRDLLASKQETLDVKESKDKTFYVKGALIPPCRTAQDLLDRVDEGTNRRQVAATELNADSSRSHSVFSLFLEMLETTEDGDVRSVTSKLNLVDLAGSERQSKTGASGDTLKEGCNINLSLSNLGTVIDCLVKGKPHIPFRSNPLTMLLKDSLGGNSKTCMFANINPSEHNISETISTLRFADRAKQIKNKPVVQLDTKDQKIKELTDQVQELKDKLKMFEGAGVKALEDELEQTKEKLGDAEVALGNAEKSREADRTDFLERLQNAENERDELAKAAKEFRLSLDALNGEKEILQHRLSSEAKRRLDWKAMLALEVFSHGDDEHEKKSSLDDSDSIDSALEAIRNMKMNLVDPKIHESKLAEADSRRKNAESQVDELATTLDKLKKELADMTFNCDQATKKTGRLQEKLEREKESRKQIADAEAGGMSVGGVGSSPTRGKSFRRQSMLDIITTSSVGNASPSSSSPVASGGVFGATSGGDVLAHQTTDFEKKFKSELEAKENVIKNLREQISSGVELAALTEELSRVKSNGDEMRQKMKEQIDALTASLAEPKEGDTDREKLIKKALLAKDAALHAALAQTEQLEKRLAVLLELRKDVAVGDIRGVEGDVIRHQSEIRAAILADLGNVSSQRNRLLALFHSNSAAAHGDEEIKKQLEKIVDENDELRKNSAEQQANGAASFKAEASALRGALVDQKRVAEEAVKLVEKQTDELHNKVAQLQREVEQAQNEALEKFLKQQQQQQHLGKKNKQTRNDGGKDEPDEDEGDNEEDPLRTAISVLQREKSSMNAEINLLSRELQRAKVELALKSGPSIHVGALASSGGGGTFDANDQSILSSADHAADDSSFETLRNECLRLRSLLAKCGISPQRTGDGRHPPSPSPKLSLDNKQVDENNDGVFAGAGDGTGFENDLQSSFLEIEQSIAKEVASANQQASELRDELETAKADVDEANDRRDAAVRERDAAQHEAAELKQQLRSAQQILDDTKSRVANLEEEGEKQKKTLEAQFSQQIHSLESRLRERGDLLAEQKKLSESQTAVAHSLKQRSEMLHEQLVKFQKEASERERRLNEQLEQQETSFQKLLTRRLEEQKEHHLKALIRKDEEMYDLRKKMKKLEDKMDKLRSQYDQQVCQYEELATAMEEQKMVQLQNLFDMGKNGGSGGGGVGGASYNNNSNSSSSGAGGRTSRQAQELRQADASRRGVDDAIRTAREERQRRNDLFGAGVGGDGNSQQQQQASTRPEPAGSAAMVAKIRKEVGGVGTITPTTTSGMSEGGYLTARVGGSSGVSSSASSLNPNSRVVLSGDTYRGGGSGYTGYVAPSSVNVLPTSLAPVPLAPMPPSGAGRPSGAAPTRGFPGMMNSTIGPGSGNNSGGNDDDMYYF